MIQRPLVNRRRWLTLLAGLCLVMLGVVAGIHLYIHRAMEPPTSRPTETVYYFAYGSNMATRYLTNIRHIPSYYSTYGQLKHYAVRFNMPGIPPLEPAFANLVAAEDKVAHGVIHEIARQDLARLTGSEGAGYQLTEVTVLTGDRGSLTAFTLVGGDNSLVAIPSQRYLDLLIEGAEQHRLPAAYITALRQQQGGYIPVISEGVGTLIYLLVILRTCC